MIVTDVHSFTDNVAPLPIIVAYALQLVDNDDVSVLSLAHALEADLALTAKVLRAANSAFYSPPEHVYTVRDAIKYIGFEGVRSLAVTTCVVGGLWVETEFSDRQKFWRHSLRCGLFARLIATRIKYPKPDVAYTLGVLHDVGRAAMIQSDLAGYRTALVTMRTAGLPLWRAEKKTFGVHHGEVGGSMAESWHLPAEYAIAIRCHHEPETADQDPVSAHIITLADSMAHAAAPNDRQGYTSSPLVHGLWDPLGMDESAVRAIFDEREYIEHHTRSLYETASIG